MIRVTCIITYIYNKIIHTRWAFAQEHGRYLYFAIQYGNLNGSRMIRVIEDESYMYCE